MRWAIGELRLQLTAILDLARVLLAIGVGCVCLVVDGEEEYAAFIGVVGEEGVGGALRLPLGRKKSVIFVCCVFLTGLGLSAVEAVLVYDEIAEALARVVIGCSDAMAVGSGAPIAAAAVAMVAAVLLMVLGPRLLLLFGGDITGSLRAAALRAFTFWRQSSLFLARATSSSQLSVCGTSINRSPIWRCW